MKLQKFTTVQFGKSVLIASLSLALGMLSISATKSVHAQNALGSGDALDRNLGVGSSGRNPSAAVQNYRDRNLLITGDVVGGRGFRGSVGYTAESDFRGRLGSNDTFQFRADSAISSPELYQLGSTFEQLRFGQ